MKKYLFLLTILTFSNCSSSKKTINKKSTKQEPILVELILNEKSENFIWKKGTYLDLSGKITNKSKFPITILSPKSSYQANPNYFSVNFIEEFEGTLCEYTVTEEVIRRSPREFITILPNQTKDIYISGRSELIKYCNIEYSGADEVKLRIFYYGRKHNFTSDSYFITNNYKTKLTKKDSLLIQDRIQSNEKYLRKKRLGEEKIKERLISYKKSLIDRIIYTTPEEQSLIIEKFNSLFPEKLISNTIVVKVEK